MSKANFSYNEYVVSQDKIRNCKGILCGIEDERNHKKLDLWY